MTRCRNLAFAVLTTATLSFGGAASAGIVYDNLSISGGTSSFDYSEGAPLGDSFSTGSGESVLSDVKLEVNATNPLDGGGFSVALTPDSSNSPDFTDSIQIAFVLDSSLTTSLGVLDIAVTTIIDLDPNTRYWIIAGGNDGSAGWSYATDDSGLGVANEYNYYLGNSLPNSVYTPYQMQVTASAVPEPSTLFIAGTATLAGLGVWSRRRGR